MGLLRTSLAIIAVAYSGRMMRTDFGEVHVSNIIARIIVDARGLIYNASRLRRGSH